MKKVLGQEAAKRELRIMRAALSKERGLYPLTMCEEKSSSKNLEEIPLWNAAFKDLVTIGYLEHKDSVGFRLTEEGEKYLYTLINKGGKNHGKENDSKRADESGLLD